MAESAEASEETIMAIAGHVSRQMLEHYSHIRQQAKRKAVAALDHVTITSQLPRWKAEAEQSARRHTKGKTGDVMVGPSGRFSNFSGFRGPSTRFFQRLPILPEVRHHAAPAGQG